MDTLLDVAFTVGGNCVMSHCVPPQNKAIATNRTSSNSKTKSLSRDQMEDVAGGGGVDVSEVVTSHHTLPYDRHLISMLSSESVQAV